MANHSVTSTGSPMLPDEYLSNRVDDQIAWYDKKSISNKNSFIRLQILILISTSIIPVISIVTDNFYARVLVALLGSIAAISTSIISLYHFREHWVEYRTTAETLKHEKFKFQTRTGPYTNDNPFPIFVERIEALISQENSKWVQNCREPSEKGK